MSNDVLLGILVVKMAQILQKKHTLALLELLSHSSSLRSLLRKLDETVKGNEECDFTSYQSYCAIVLGKFMPLH